MKNLFLTGIFICLTCIGIHAQLNGYFTQHSLNKYQFNPAFGGLERSLSIHLASRSQWTNLSDNPAQQYLAAHMPAYLLQGGVGIQIQNESQGLFTNTSGSLSYNYILQSSMGLFSFGAAVGITKTSLNGRGITTPDGIYTDIEINHNDPQLSELAINANTLINSVGIYYAGDLFEGGISVLNIPSRRSGLNPSNILFDPIISFYLESFFFVGNQSNRVTPSILLMTNGSATQITTGAIGEFGNILAGLSIRGFSSKSIDGLNFIIGSKVNPKLRISYSYDYGLNSLQVFSEGSHELQINYNLNKQISWGLPPKIRYNPRSL